MNLFKKKTSIQALKCPPLDSLLTPCPLEFMRLNTLIHQLQENLQRERRKGQSDRKQVL